MTTPPPPPPRDDEWTSLGRFLYDAFANPSSGARWEDLSDVPRGLWCAAADIVARKALRERDAINAELLDAARAVLNDYDNRHGSGIGGPNGARLRRAVEAAEREKEG